MQFENKVMEQNLQELYKGLVQSSIITGGRKRFIEDCIITYRSEFNEEYIQHLKNLKEYHDNLINPTGRDKNSEIDLRAAVSIPNRLYKLLSLQLSNPHFLEDNKELRWFMRKFPEFSLPTKI